MNLNAPKEYHFQIYFQKSQNFVLCSKDFLFTLTCRVAMHSGGGNNHYFTVIHKVDHPGIYPTIADAPNGKDVWLSGGLSYELKFYNNYFYDSVFLEKTITILK